MALELIGAGLGRTGTLSLKAALERLGYGPCYHMIEVLSAPERAQHWLEQSESGSDGWGGGFRGYPGPGGLAGPAVLRGVGLRHPHAQVLPALCAPHPRDER